MDIRKKRRIGGRKKKGRKGGREEWREERKILLEVNSLTGKLRFIQNYDWNNQKAIIPSLVELYTHTQFVC